MTANELFQSGKLQEAIQALGSEVRQAPLDTRRRTFLFELLCIAGEFERAEKHLDILSDASPQARVGSVLYRSAIHAEKTRQKMFVERTYPAPHKLLNFSGARNQSRFQSFADADDRLRGFLEVFVAGSYTWISLEHIAALEVAPPRRLRDLLWIPAVIAPAPSYEAMELGEVLLPVLCPSSFTHSDANVQLGRSTVWEQTEYGCIPSGQKTFLIDEVEIPLLELGKIEFSHAVGERRAASA